MPQLMRCPVCDLLQRVEQPGAGRAAHCSRCGARMLQRKKNSLHRTAAFSLAALILYVPANIYPILRMDYYGAYSESTVWDGCGRLFRDGMWPVAIIVFLASIIIPLFKLLGLFFLVVTAKSMKRQKERTRVFRFIEVIGPWAMLDVYLLAVLVAVVKLEQLATILPGPGLLAFTAVVVLTILASACFDPRLIWDKPQRVAATL